VDKWLPIEEVEQHILFKGFHKECKDFFFHGKVDILDRVKYKGSTSQEINDNPSKLVGKDNMDNHYLELVLNPFHPLNPHYL